MLDKLHIPVIVSVLGLHIPVIVPVLGLYSTHISLNHFLFATKLSLTLNIYLVYLFIYLIPILRFIKKLVILVVDDKLQLYGRRQKTDSKHALTICWD